MRLLSPQRLARPRAGRALAIILASSCLWVVAACRPAPTQMPEHLLGVWRTDAPRHARNFIEIRPAEVVLGVAGLELEVIRIEKIDVGRARRGEAIHRLHFTAAEGYPDVLELTWLEDQRAMRVGAAMGTWTRSAAR